MDLVLEVRPSACLFLLGPQLTRSESERMSYKSVLEGGFTFLQQQRRRKRGTGSILDLDDLRKMDVVSAMQRVIELLRKEGLHKDWLRRMLGGSRLQSFDFPDSLQWMLELQQMGSMLVCTQYDTLLDDMAGQSPVTLRSDDPRFVKWLEIGKQHCSKRETMLARMQSSQGGDAERSTIVDLSKGEKCGILHLHGVHTKLESISLLPYCSVTLKNSSSSGESGESEDRSCVKDLGECLQKDHLVCLRKIFHNKLVLMIGFDSDCYDPLLPSLLRVIYPDGDLQSRKNPPILLTSSPPSSYSSLTQDLVLQLKLRSPKNLRDVLVPGSSSNFTIGREHMEVIKNFSPQAFLLFNEKQSFRKLGDIFYQQSKSGEIYVCRDALTVVFDHTKILYGNLVTYDGDGLRQLWELVFTKDSMLVGKGLLGLGLQSSVFVWLNGKPKGITNITGINSVHTNAAHKAIQTMSLAQRPISTSSTSSVESFSDSRSPPFFISVSTTAQTVGLDQLPASSHPSIITTLKKDRTGEEWLDGFVSSSSAVEVGNSSCSNSTTALSPFSAPVIPPSLPSFFVTHNPLSRKLVTASPASILNQIPFSIPAMTSAPISIPQTSGSQSILPQLLPFSVPSLISDHPNFSPVAPLAYLYPHNINPVHLEKLTNLNREFSSQIQATAHTVTPVVDNGMNAQMKVCLASKLTEWKGEDNAAPVTKEFTHCVAGPAKVLQSLSSYQEHMRTVLAENEHKIEYIDTQSIHRKSEKNIHMTIMVKTNNGSVLTTTSAGNSSVCTISPTGAKVAFDTAHHLSLIRDSSVTALPSSLLTSSTPPPLLEVPSLSANYLSNLLSTLAYGQTNLASLTRANTLTTPTSTSGNNLLTAAASLLYPTHQTLNLLPPPPQHVAALNYCILPSTFQQITGTSRSNTASSPPTAINMTNTTASVAVALPLLQQSPTISGVPMPQTSEVLLNNLTLPAGAMNRPMYYTMPTGSVVRTAVQPVLPQTKVDPPAALTLLGARPMGHSLTARQIDQSADNLAPAHLRNTSDGGRIGIADGTNTDKVRRLLKRKRSQDFPDCMGEKILKLVNPSAIVPSSSSPLKFSNAVANQNHPRWSGDMPGRSVSDATDVTKHISQGHIKDSSSSESEGSTQVHMYSKRSQE